MSHSGINQRFEARRTQFIGRVQEQRQFRQTLTSLLAHQAEWAELALEIGNAFDPHDAPGDDSYPRVFLLHGIGGIGKTWLTRRCLELARNVNANVQPLAFYLDVSLGQPASTPTHIMDRFSALLIDNGYEEVIVPYEQAKSDTATVRQKVAQFMERHHERFDNISRWTGAAVGQGVTLLSAASEFPLGSSMEEMISGSSGRVLSSLYETVLTAMRDKGELTLREIALFRDPDLTQAATLTAALQRVAIQRPIVIALDTLEVAVPQEQFIRDQLVQRCMDAPILWMLSGRHNLADERTIEVAGKPHIQKGYRDVLGLNPPVVWDVNVFSDSDIRSYLEVETRRRGQKIEIDDAIVAAVKQSSGGVPLAVEIVVDARLILDREAFLRDFALHHGNLLPAERLERVTARFLRYCLNEPTDLICIQAMALLNKQMDALALRAAWVLPSDQQVQAFQHRLSANYAFMDEQGLHDAVYKFVRRQLLTDPLLMETRRELSRRTVGHYQTEWELEHHLDEDDDPALRTRDPRWQTTTRHLLNALLWADPDIAVQFLLRRLIEAICFDPSFAGHLLGQVDEFLSNNSLPLRRTDADRVRKLRADLNKSPNEGSMLELLLRTSNLEALHLCCLYVGRGKWLQETQQYDSALTSYLEARRYLSAADVELRKSLSGFLHDLGHTFDELNDLEKSVLVFQEAIELEPNEIYLRVCLWKIYHERGQSEEAQGIYQQAIQLDCRESRSWYGLGYVYSALNRYPEAIEAYQHAIQLDAKNAAPWRGLGNAHSALNRHPEAIEAYQHAIQLDEKNATSWYRLGNAYSTLNRHPEAIEAYQHAIQLDAKNAAPWRGLGNAYSALNHHPEAVEAYQQAIQLDAKNADLRHRLAHAYIEQNRVEDAINAFRKAIELEPQDPHHWSCLGNLYHTALNRHSEAIEAFQRALDLDASYPYVYNNLAGVYLDLGQLPEARQYFQKRIELSPEDALTARVSLGIIDVYENDQSQARLQFEAALALGDVAWQRHVQSEFGLLENKALALLCLGQTDAALVTLREALEKRLSGDTIEFTRYDLLASASKPLAGLTEMRNLLEEASKKGHGSKAMRISG